MQEGLTPNLLMRIRNFINIFASQCNGCVRKNPYNCANCDDVNLAKSLLLEIDRTKFISEQKYYVENDVDLRYVNVIKAIRQAGRPLTSNEIRMEGITRGLKCYTLKKMCQREILFSRVNENGHYEFYVNEKSNFIRNKARARN